MHSACSSRQKRTPGGRGTCPFQVRDSRPPRCSAGDRLRLRGHSPAARHCLVGRTLERSLCTRRARHGCAVVHLCAFHAHLSRIWLLGPRNVVNMHSVDTASKLAFIPLGARDSREKQRERSRRVMHVPAWEVRGGDHVSGLPPSPRPPPSARRCRSSGSRASLPRRFVPPWRGRRRETWASCARRGSSLGAGYAAPGVTRRGLAGNASHEAFCACRASARDNSRALLGAAHEDPHCAEQRSCLDAPGLPLRGAKPLECWCGNAQRAQVHRRARAQELCRPWALWASEVLVYVIFPRGRGANMFTQLAKP